MDEKQDSLLQYVKDMLGVSPDDTVFDKQLCVYISSAVFKLKEIGVSVNNIPITESTSYEDLFPYSDESMKAQITMYLYYKTKQLFDSPTNGTVNENLKEEIREAEWRLNAFVDPPENFREEASISK